MACSAHFVQPRHDKSVSCIWEASTDIQHHGQTYSVDPTAPHYPALFPSHLKAMRDGGRVFVGNLPKDPPATEADLRDKFERYGELQDVWVARKPPGFAFVQFQDPRDAEEAVRSEAHNRENWRVEISHKDPSDKGPNPSKKRTESRGKPRDDEPPQRGSPTPLRERDGYGSSGDYDYGYDDYYGYSKGPKHRSSRRSRSRSKDRSRSRSRNRDKERKGREKSPPHDDKRKSRSRRKEKSYDDDYY